MSLVILKGHIVVDETDLQAVAEELPRHAELTRQEPGCIKFEATQDEKDPHIFHIYEEFVDPEAFEAHQKRAKSSRWGEISGNIARHYKVTESSS